MGAGIGMVWAAMGIFRPGVRVLVRAGRRPGRRPGRRRQLLLMLAPFVVPAE